MTLVTLTQKNDFTMQSLLGVFAPMRRHLEHPSPVEPQILLAEFPRLMRLSTRLTNRFAGGNAVCAFRLKHRNYCSTRVNYLHSPSSRELWISRQAPRFAKPAARPFWSFVCSNGEPSFQSKVVGTPAGMGALANTCRRRLLWFCAANEARCCPFVGL